MFMCDMQFHHLKVGHCSIKAQLWGGSEEYDEAESSHQAAEQSISLFILPGKRNGKRYTSTAMNNNS